MSDRKKIIDKIEGFLSKPRYQNHKRYGPGLRSLLDSINEQSDVWCDVHSFLANTSAINLIRSAKDCLGNDECLHRQYSGV